MAFYALRYVESALRCWHCWQWLMEYILESIKTIYSIKHENGQIRRVNINIAATTVENYKKLKDAEI